MIWWWRHVWNGRIRRHGRSHWSNWLKSTWSYASCFYVSWDCCYRYSNNSASLNCGRRFIRLVCIHRRSRHFLEPIYKILRVAKRLVPKLVPIWSDVNNFFLHWLRALDVQAHPRQYECPRLRRLKANAIRNSIWFFVAFPHHKLDHVIGRTSLECLVIGHQHHEIIQSFDVTRVNLIQVGVRFTDKIRLVDVELLPQPRIPGGLPLLNYFNVHKPIGLERPRDGQRIGPLGRRTNQHFPRASLALGPKSVLCFFVVAISEKRMMNMSHSSAWLCLSRPRCACSCY